MTRLTNWAGQAVKQTGWNLNPRAALGGMALLGGLALLAALYLALSSQTAVLGRRVQDLEAERALIIRENAYLRDQIARFASVSSMTLRALTEHYVTTGTVQFLPVDPEQSQEDEQSQTPP